MRRLILAICLAALGACAGAQPVPEEKPAAPTADPNAFRANAPAPGQPPELVTPKFESFTLDNGLTVYVSEPPGTTEAGSATIPTATSTDGIGTTGPPTTSRTGKYGRTVLEPSSRSRTISPSVSRVRNAGMKARRVSESTASPD